MGVSTAPPSPNGGEPDGQRRAALPEADAGGRPLSVETPSASAELPMLKQITAAGHPPVCRTPSSPSPTWWCSPTSITFGSDAMAGCGSYAKVEGFVFLPITSFAMALTTLRGRIWAQGQYDRAKRGGTGGASPAPTLLAELIGLTLLLVAPYAIALFNDDPAVIAIGIPADPDGGAVLLCWPSPTASPP